MQVTPEPSPGEKRRAKNFVLRLSTECESTLDVLFSKQKETSAVHFNIGQGGDSIEHFSLIFSLKNGLCFHLRLPTPRKLIKIMGIFQMWDHVESFFNLKLEFSLLNRVAGHQPRAQAAVVRLGVGSVFLGRDRPKPKF